MKNIFYNLMLFLLINVMFYSCAEKKSDKLASNEKVAVIDDFPFINTYKLDTSKMKVIDERCVVEAFYTWNAAKEKARINKKRFCYQCMPNFYDVMDFVSWSNMGLQFSKKKKIPVVKIDSLIDVVCFVDSSNTKYFISVDKLKTRTGLIYFDATKKPTYIDRIQTDHAYGYDEWYFGNKK